MSTMKTGRLNDFMLGLWPAQGADAVWTNHEGHLCRLDFSGDGMTASDHPIPGNKMNADFTVSPGPGPRQVLVRVGRGVSLYDLSDGSDKLALVPGFEYSAPAQPHAWAEYVAGTPPAVLVPFKFDPKPEAVWESVFHAEVHRLKIPPEGTAPISPDYLGLDRVSERKIDLGEGGLAFPGPGVVLARTRDSARSAGYAWSAYDSDLRPVRHAAADFLNGTDTLPPFDLVALSRSRPFALARAPAGPRPGSLTLIGWKGKPAAQPVLFDSVPLAPLRHLLLSPADTHFLAEDVNGGLYLGEIREQPEGFTATVRRVREFPSTIELAWMGSGKGFVAGLREDDQTDVYFWWLPL